MNTITSLFDIQNVYVKLQITIDMRYRTMSGVESFSSLAASIINSCSEFISCQSENIHPFHPSSAAFPSTEACFQSTENTK